MFKEVFVFYSVIVLSVNVFILFMNVHVLEGAI